jgi:hypothetical protein
MIRYRIAEKIDQLAAATCEHPLFARLRGLGWQARYEGNATIMTAASAVTRTDWGEWRPGLGGLEFAVPDPLPPFSVNDWKPTQPDNAQLVTLKCGQRIWVTPAYLDGGEILLDGTIAASTSRYGQLVDKIDARLNTVAHLAAGDPDVLGFARLAIQTCLCIPDEAIHAWRLLSSSDIQALWRAATALPKAESDAAGSPSAAPESIPGA